VGGERGTYKSGIAGAMASGTAIENRPAWYIHMVASRYHHERGISLGSQRLPARSNAGSGANG